MPTTEAITPVSDRSAVMPAARVDNPGAILDRDAFLKLLVTQLKYQDPANPADTSQLVTQSAQLTMVDRLNEIADAMTASSAIDRMTLAGTMIGREIEFRADDGSTRIERVFAVRFEAGRLTVLAGEYSVPLEAITQLLAPPVTEPAPPGDPAEPAPPGDPAVPPPPVPPPA